MIDVMYQGTMVLVAALVWSMDVYVVVSFARQLWYTHCLYITLKFSISLAMILSVPLTFLVVIFIYVFCVWKGSYLLVELESQTNMSNWVESIKQWWEVKNEVIMNWFIFFVFAIMIKQSDEIIHVDCFTK